MDAWAEFCAKPTMSAGSVVTIAGAAACVGPAFSFLVWLLDDGHFAGREIAHRQYCAGVCCCEAPCGVDRDLLVDAIAVRHASDGDLEVRACPYRKPKSAPRAEQNEFFLDAGATNLELTKVRST
jgi:hypothetical protein